MKTVLLYFLWLILICMGAFFIWDAFDTFIKEGPTFLFAVDIMIVISTIVNLIKIIMK